MLCAVVMWGPWPGSSGRWFFFSSRRRHTRSLCDWSSDVCSSDLDLSLTQGLPSTWRTRYGPWVIWLVYAGLALGIVALARPQAVLKGEAAKARGIDIMKIGRASCRERG